MSHAGAPRPAAVGRDEGRVRALLSTPAEGEVALQARNLAMTALSGLAAVVMLAPFAAILLHALARGLPGLSLEAAARGALRCAEVALLPCAIAIPVGVGAGIYLAEVGRGTLARRARRAADALGGVPSVAAGVFAFVAFGMLAGPARASSSLAAGVALAIVMIPRIIRTTDEQLRLVPASLREAALGLGVPAWRTTLFVVLRTALPGVGAGVLLALSRVAGETAPLLVTVGPSTSTDAPLPTAIFTRALEAHPHHVDEAWTQALVLLGLVLALNLLGRSLVAERPLLGRRP